MLLISVYERRGRLRAYGKSFTSGHRFSRVWRVFLPFGFNDSFATVDVILSTCNGLFPTHRDFQTRNEIETTEISYQPSTCICENTSVRKLLEESDGFISFSFVVMFDLFVTQYAERGIVWTDLWAWIRTSCGEIIFFFRQLLSWWIIILRAKPWILR